MGSLPTGIYFIHTVADTRQPRGGDDNKLPGAAAEAVSAEFTPLFGDGGRPLCAGCVLNWTGDATAEQLAAPARLRASLSGRGETVAVLGAGSILGTTKPAVLQLCVGAVLNDAAATADDDDEPDATTLSPTSVSDAELALSVVALRLRSASRRTRSVALPLASLPWWSPAEARAAAAVARAQATAAWEAPGATDAVHPLSVCDRFGCVVFRERAWRACVSPPSAPVPCGIASCRGDFFKSEAGFS